MVYRYWRRGKWIKGECVGTCVLEGREHADDVKSHIMARPAC